MQYLIQFLEPAASFAQRNDPEKAPAYWGAWGAYIKTLEESGIIVNGAGLLPPETATTVRMRNGERMVQDGPFAEAKEMLGGFFIVEVPTLDVALEWASRSPSAEYGSVEVRPVMPPMPG
jgi:hypothetical protein